jgi:hypothetical protein
MARAAGDQRDVHLPIADLLPEPKLIFRGNYCHCNGRDFRRRDRLRRCGSWNAMYSLWGILILLFVVDASVTLWRRRKCRRAAVVGHPHFLYGDRRRAGGLVEAGMRTPYSSSGPIWSSWRDGTGLSDG